MKVICERFLELRNSYGLSQMKLSKKLGISQTALNRYEHGECGIPDKVILAVADYFDVSADYLLGRTDNPEGMLFAAQPQIYEESKDVRKFIEMCFDPETQANRQLKEKLFQMMSETEGGGQ
jgi:transcriptional regulator with XRE-family HTH domain